ncbi:MAG: DegT/DnrJ/EryC1/StrS family aminotransferase [Salinibacter sp.]
MSSSDSIPLARPVTTGREQEAINTVLASGQLSRGPFVEAFEHRMADQCDTAHAVAVSSGTAALHCIVRALDLPRGAEVITTPFSFVASTNVLLYEDLQPRFVDIDPVTYNLDIEAVDTAITSQTEAVLGVDVFGVPANWPALHERAEAHDLRLIDDACEALGARLGDHPAGSWGDAGAFGFYPNKQITTGEGGCITTNDPDLAHACRALRNHGRTGNGRMTHERLGYNYRLDELSAAVGCAQLDRLDTALGARAEVASQYEEILSPLRDDLVLPPTSPSGRRSWFVYVVRLRDHFTAAARDQLLASLQDAGIGCAPYFPPIHLQPYHRKRLGHAPGDFPVCERIARRTLALPFYESLSTEAITRVAETLSDLLPTLPRT